MWFWLLDSEGGLVMVKMKDKFKGKIVFSSVVLGDFKKFWDGF